MKKTINAELLRKMFIAGARRLEVNKEYVNDLNVFPVPDGDTGTNMTKTILSAEKEALSIEELNMKNLAKALSSGSLRGARGNSGVILSQLIRGFSKEIENFDKLDVKIINSAIQRAVETAYKAVIKPKEGTILTVAKSAAIRSKAIYKKCTDIGDYLSQIIEEMENTLEKTPEMLPILKEAGVVDSGGQGLLFVVKGMYDAYMGVETVEVKKVVKIDKSNLNFSNIETADMKYLYCTEFIVLLKEENESAEDIIRDYLLTIGDSLVVVADDSIVKVHVHTNDPGLAFQKALEFGELSSMKIDNMKEEHNEKYSDEEFVQNHKNATSVKKEEVNSSSESEKEEIENNINEIELEEESIIKLENSVLKNDISFVAVSSGDGIRKVFEEIGVDVLVQGGQTMNPSTDDFVKAIELTNTNNVIVFPNNKNIILSANQAVDIIKDKKVVVIPTKNIPQGIESIVAYTPEYSLEENEKKMKEAINQIYTGQLTIAVRDTTILGTKIENGNYIGMGDNDILVVSEDLVDASLKLVEELTSLNDDLSIITVYFGKDLTDNEKENIENMLNQNYQDFDIEYIHGDQPVYHLLVSVA